MNIRQALLADLDHECAVTRRVLERVPAGSLAWKPHEKSFSLGGLATHLSQLPHWGTQILDRDVYDLATAGPHRDEATSVAEVLTTFDRHAAEVRQSLLTHTDAELTSMWSLKRGHETMLSMPRASALRSFLLHHLIHHRGQLTVYLRLLDVPLPPIYGPSADEPL
ncbi:MAG: DinB family protein [Vicinamibacterales bacterium]